MELLCINIYFYFFLFKFLITRQTLSLLPHIFLTLIRRVPEYDTNIVCEKKNVENI